MKTLNNIDILIVDDDARMRETLNDILTEEGYEIRGVGTITHAKEELKKRFFNLALIDLKLPDGTGLELLKEIKKINAETMVIVFTGYASLESSITALNEGAFAYIQKPLNMDEVIISIEKALYMQKLSIDNKNLLNRLKELSLKDPHTELYNYRYLIERLASEIKRATRYYLPLSIIMIDIDYFKSINDVYGHTYGDNILKEFSQYLKSFARGNDVVIRYGGEEFVILLPDTNRENAIVFGGRLLAAIKKHIFDTKGKKIRLKISMGLSSFIDGGVSTEGLMDSVDRALHEAKESGGNRLAIFRGISEAEKVTAKKGVRENVNKLKGKLIKMENRVNQTLLESIYAFAKTIKAKDYYTSEHIDKTVSIVTKIGEKLNLYGKELENLKHAAILHDLGKIGIPDKILGKKGRLTKKEYEVIKNHPQIGAEIIRSVHFLKDVVPIILHHHERFDGKGYPSGLDGKRIPPGARIIAIADVYQALISDRPYRKAYNKEKALKIIKEGSGTQFDPEIVKAFLSVIKESRK